MILPKNSQSSMKTNVQFQTETDGTQTDVADITQRRCAEPLKSAQTAAPPRGHMQERVHGKLTFPSSALRHLGTVNCVHTVRISLYLNIADKHYARLSYLRRKCCGIEF